MEQTLGKHSVRLHANVPFSSILRLFSKIFRKMPSRLSKTFFCKNIFHALKHTLNYSFEMDNSTSFSALSRASETNFSTNFRKNSQHTCDFTNTFAHQESKTLCSLRFERKKLKNAISKFVTLTNCNT
jgi:hypothetical protein